MPLWKVEWHTANLAERKSYMAKWSRQFPKQTLRSDDTLSQFNEARTKYMPYLMLMSSMEVSKSRKGRKQQVRK